MQIVENLDAWTRTYNNGWLKEFSEHQRINWDIYEYAKNTLSVPGPAIDLTQSKLIFISSAGGYISSLHEPFDAENPLGDYSQRLISTHTDLSEIKYAHEHYDQSAVIEDPQVLLPLTHLQEMVNQKKIGEVSDKVISYMGYQPDVNRILRETIPAILELVTAEKADAALLVPS